MKIANIIYEKELVNHTNAGFVDYINKPTQYIDIDTSLPTLYVGWKFMKSCNPNNDTIKNVNILKKVIIKNRLYWEYSFGENKASHIKGVELFVNDSPKLFFNSKYEYVNIDPVFHQLKTIDDLLKICPPEIDVSYNYKNELIYLLSDNKIFGINLNMFEFFKFDINTIIEQFGGRTNKVNYDPNGDFYVENHKLFPNFDNLRRYLVTF